MANACYNSSNSIHLMLIESLEAITKCLCHKHLKAWYISAALLPDSLVRNFKHQNFSHIQ